MLRVTTLCFQTLDVAWNSSVHIIKSISIFPESQPQSEPSRFTPLCHERSLRARKGRHVNLTLFQFANLSPCAFFFFLPALSLNFGRIIYFWLSCSSHADATWTWYSCQSSRHRRDFIIILFALLSQSIFYLLAPLSSPGLQLSTRDDADDDDVNANKDVIEKQGSPSPLIRHDPLGFFFSVFVPHQPCRDDGEKSHRWRTRSTSLSDACVGGGKTKHSAMATALKSTLKLIYLQKQWILCWHSRHFGAFLLLFFVLCAVLFLWQSHIPS